MASIFLISVSGYSRENKVEFYEHPSEIIVKFKTNSESAKGLTSLRSIESFIDSEVLTDNISKLSLKGPLESSLVMEDILNDPTVEWAERNIVVSGDPRELTPNDPSFQKQYHHQIMETQESWDILNSSEAQEVIVAVTDDGIQLDHEDLKNILYQNPGEIADNGIDDDNNGYIDDVLGWNFSDGNNNAGVHSSHGSHGTHVAGIIAAESNNSLGVTGIAPNVKIMPLKFYGAGGLSAAKYLKAYKYAADNGAKIITTSYNIDGMTDSKTYREAVNYAYSKGLLVFNSAGNGRARQSKRTKLQKVILVCSTKSKSASDADLLSNFSNYGRGVDVCAPGDPILSTDRNGTYTTKSGTSMASPNAAAVAAMIWAQNPEWSKSQVLSKLMMSTDDLEVRNPDRKRQLGNGRVNAKKSLMNGLTPVTIQGVDIKENESEIHFHIKGILDENVDLEKALDIVSTESYAFPDPVIKKVESLTQYGLGTNLLKYKLQLPTGKYQVRLLSNILLDPFGNELDGNADGTPGGDFIYELKQK